jgi:MFS family permease
MAVMAGAAAVMQTPVGFLVDRYGARPFLVGGTLLMTLSIAAMGLATAYSQVVGLALLSGSATQSSSRRIARSSASRWIGRNRGYMVGLIGGARVEFRGASVPAAVE